MEGGPFTESQLSMKRSAFWDSCASHGGDPTVWLNLRLAAEALLEGNTELADTVVEASEVRVSGPDLTACYDSTGKLYGVPAWACRNPSNMVSEDEMRRMAHSAKKAHVGAVKTVRCTLRLSASTSTLEQDVKIDLASDMTGADIKAALNALLLSGKADQAADPSTPRPNVWSACGGLPPARMRLVYRGRIIDDAVYLQEAAIPDGDIVQVFIKPI